MTLDIHKILEIDYRLESGDRPKSKEHMKMVEDYLSSENCVRVITEALKKELEERDIFEGFDLNKFVSGQTANIFSLIKVIYETKYVSTKYENFDKIFEESYKEICFVLSKFDSDSLFRLYNLNSRLQIPFVVFVKYYHFFITQVIVERKDSIERGMKVNNSNIIEYLRSVIRWYTGGDPEGRYLLANLILQPSLAGSNVTKLKEALEKPEIESLAKNLLNLDNTISDSDEKRSVYIKLCNYESFSVLEDQQLLNTLINDLTIDELRVFLNRYEKFHESVIQNYYLRKDSDYIKYMSQVQSLIFEEFVKEILLSYFKDQNILIQATGDEESPSPVFRLNEIENALCANSVTIKSAFNYYIEKSLKLILKEHKTKNFNPIQLTLAAYAVKSVNSWFYSRNRQLTSKLLFEKLSNKTIDTEYISKIFGHIVLEGFKKELNMTEDEELIISEDVVIEWLIEMHCSDKKDTESWMVPFLNHETYDSYVK